MAAKVVIGDETITVSTVAIGPTTAEVSNRVDLATFHLVSGGTLNWRIGNTPIAAGGAGETGQVADDHWEVSGFQNIRDFLMVKRTAESDAIVGVVYWGVTHD